MPQFLSPGIAAANAIEEYMLRKAELERQARADRMAEELHQSKLEDVRIARERQQKKDELDLQDRERKLIKEQTEGMVVGDQFKPELLARAHAADVPMRTQVEPPMAAEMSPPGIIQELSPEGVSGETPVAEVAPGAIRFGGSPEQAKEAEKKRQQDEFIKTLRESQGKPGVGQTGAAMSAAARAVDLPMSAADFEPPAERAVSAGIQEYERYKADQIAAGKTFLSFDEYQERDANRRRPVIQGSLPGGELNPKQMSVALQIGNAMKADPVYKDMLDIQTGYVGVKNGLSQKGGLGDIAAINALQRMVDPGATVREGDVKLIQSANAFLERMNPTYWLARLEKGDKLPEGTRSAMLKLAQELYSVRLQNYEQMSGKKYKALAKSGGLPFELIGADFEPAEGPKPAAAKDDKPGMPKVGDTFMGGKVISVD